MKFIILVALALAAVAVAAPAEPPKILRSEFETKPDGSYVYSYETEDGINRVENGEVREVLDEDNKPHAVVTVRGSFSYTDSDGKLQTITYFADETGFHPEGDSIPKSVSRR